jgi:hypothetical protein
MSSSPGTRSNGQIESRVAMANKITAIKKKTSAVAVSPLAMSASMALSFPPPG